MVEKTPAGIIFDAIDDIVTINFKIRNLAEAFDANNQPQIGDELRDWANSLGDLYVTVKDEIIKILQKEGEKPKAKKSKKEPSAKLFEELDVINKELTENIANLTKLLMTRK